MNLSGKGLHQQKRQYQFHFKTMKKTIFLIFSFILLCSYIRGPHINPLYYQFNNNTKIEGPFEISTSASRYALTKSIVENHRFFLNPQLAQFASPDIASYKGKILSIFPPGIAFIGIPFYIMGKFFGIPQFFTFFSIVLFAFLDLILVAKLSRRFGAGVKSAMISGFVFLFATNALVYSQLFLQHIVTAFFLLISLLIVTKKVDWKSYFMLGLLFSLSILIDVPNVIIVAPILIYALVKNTHIKTYVAWFIVGIIPFLLIFCFYNYKTTGSPFILAQNIGRSDLYRYTTGVQNPAEYKHNVISSNLNIGNAFEINDPLRGLYILLFSNERSWLFYSPVVFLGFIGFWIAYTHKKIRALTLVCLIIILINILLYAVYDDPWGGWAFGPRYLIPSAAILSAGIGVFLEKYKRNLLSILIFLILFMYSSAVSSLGALTTSVIPPQMEVVNRNLSIPSTYLFNWQLLTSNKSSSLIYNLFLNPSIKLEYFFVILILITTMAGLSIPFILKTKKK